MLTLPIKKKWFDMILSGQKTEEYREIKEYYETRFRNVFGPLAAIGRIFGEPTEIRFRNGYGENRPSIIAKCTLTMGTGKKEWGAEPHKFYYILQIHEVRKEK